MSKSPTRSALTLASAFALLSAVWIIFNHYGSDYLMIIDANMIHHDEPADLIFATATSFLLFFVVRRYLTAQEQAQLALRRANDELEMRVLQRTSELDAERSNLRRILDAMPDGVCIIGQNYSLEYINPMMEKTWGAVDGQRCYTYFEKRSLPCPDCHLAQIKPQQRVHWEWNAEVVGKTFDVIGTIIEAPDGGNATLFALHDMTEQATSRRKIEEMSAEKEHQVEELRKAHIETNARARELAALLEISHSMASTLQSEVLLEVILDQLHTMVEYHSAILYLLEGDGITAVAYRGDLAAERVIGLHIPLSSAPGCMRLVEQRQPILVDDIRGDSPLAQAIRDAALTYFPHTLETTRAWMGVPLVVNEQIFGMLRLDHSQPSHFTQHDAGLAFAIANQAAVAMENARLYEEAQKVAVLEERQRMARDLHDSVSQALYGIALGAHAAREQLQRAPDKLNGTLDYILAMSATAVSEMRALVFELRPDSLVQEGMRAALTKQADALRARTGATVNVEICEEPALTPDGAEMIYRIAQEAMQNIAKHARARNVNLRLGRQDSWVILEVADDGIGFEPCGRFPGHYGLKTMHERALRLRGTLEIESSPNAGAIIRARIPAIKSNS